jgi:hypothetical protein
LDFNGVYIDIFRAEGRASGQKRNKTALRKRNKKNEEKMFTSVC